jgi:hypothetical protein
MSALCHREVRTIRDRSRNQLKRRTKMVEGCITVSPKEWQCLELLNKLASNRRWCRYVDHFPLFCMLLPPGNQTNNESPWCWCGFGGLPWVCVFAHFSSGPVRTPQRPAQVSTDFLGGKLSNSHLPLVRLNLYLCAQSHIERVQYPDGTLQSDAEVFVALVA